MRDQGDTSKSPMDNLKMTARLHMMSAQQTSDERVSEELAPAHRIRQQGRQCAADNRSGELGDNQ
jgi:hypothetical protein